MHLLRYNDKDELIITAFFEDDIPRNYAILSHTWGSEEVTFEDLAAGVHKTKAGYRKILFCGEQARRDGLQYFWVDTCCINKSDSTELAEAINSMFRWYSEAAKCYVYLSDVSTKEREASDPLGEYTWESAFRSSRWFTRGWTLQELLAPGQGLVEFFSREGDNIGNKRSLEQKIHEITGIAIAALQGTALSQFGIDERLKWAETRRTTRAEDSAYCLLGIFGVFMPLIYGEGKENAMRRLQKEIKEFLISQKGMSSAHWVNFR